MFAFLLTLSSFPERGKRRKSWGKWQKGRERGKISIISFFTFDREEAFLGGNDEGVFLQRTKKRKNNQAVGEAQRKSARVCAAKELERAGGRARGLQRQRQRRRLRMQVIVDSLLFGKTLFRDVIGSTRSHLDVVVVVVVVVDSFAKKAAAALLSGRKKC